MNSRIATCFIVVVACMACPVHAETLPVTDNSLVLWLKADAGVTVTGGRVSQWDDQLVGDNTSSNDAAQTNATYRPTVFANASPNGLLPMMRFDKGPYLAIADADDLDPDAGGFTIFIAGKASHSDADSRGWLNKQGSGGSSDDGYSIWSTINANEMNGRVAGVGGAPENKGSQSHARSSDFGVLTMQLTGSEIFGFLDGSSTGWTDGGNGPTDNDYTGSVSNSTALEIGRGGYDNTLPLSGDIGEIIIYKSELNGTDRGKVESYLNDKWVVPEPTSLALLTIGSLAVVFVSWMRRRRRKV